MMLKLKEDLWHMTASKLHMIHQKTHFINMFREDATHYVFQNKAWHNQVYCLVK